MLAISYCKFFSSSKNLFMLWFVLIKGLIDNVKTENDTSMGLVVSEILLPYLNNRVQNKMNTYNVPPGCQKSTKETVQF